MKIRYTIHAVERMKQRGISRKLVEECLQIPDKDEELEQARRCIKKIDDELLVVIYTGKDYEITVITAYKTTKAHKYI